MIKEKEPRGKKPDLSIKGIASLSDEVAELWAVEIVAKHSGYISPKGARQALKKRDEEAARRARGRRDGR